MKANKITVGFLFIGLFSSVANAQYDHILPDDKKIELDSEYKKMYEKEKTDKVQLLEKLEQYKATGNTNQDSTSSNIPSTSSINTSQNKNGNINTGSNAQDLNRMLDGYSQMLKPNTPSVSQANDGVIPAPVTVKPQSSDGKISNSSQETSTSSNGFATPATAFNVTGYGGEQTVLPAGSAVHVTFLTGLEAVKGTNRDLLFEADTVFDGPNGKKIDLRNCRIIATGTADLSIERVIITPKLISCVRSDGAYFERPLEGFVAGKDNSYGQIGLFQSKQGQVFIQALIAKVVGGISAATAAADTTTSLAAGNAGAALSATNVTGDKLQYGVLTGIGQAGEMVTQWYLDQAKELLPSIATPSGSKGWVITSKSIQIPSLNPNK